MVVFRGGVDRKLRGVVSGKGWENWRVVGVIAAYI